MKIEIVKRETIKPSSPTPLNLRRFKLSVMDQLSPQTYAPIVLFYPSASVEAVDMLKKSLSETTTHFYPLAGRIKDNNNFIECNDEGALYVEAQVHGILLSDFLQKPNNDGLKQFIPVKLESPESITGPLLVVQVSFFHCGGLAITVCMSHRLGDASTLSIFVRAWSALSLHENKLLLSLLPHFETTAFRFPGEGRDISVLTAEIMKSLEDTIINNSTTSSCWVTKRFVFNASTIASLKAKAASKKVQQPTRFEAVMALIWRCAIAASTILNSDKKQHVLDFSVNLRNKVVPPLPETSVGNLVSFISVKAMETTTMSLEDMGDSTKRDQLMKYLVADLRMQIKEFCESKAKKKFGGDPDDALEAVSLNLIEFADKMRRSKEINSLFATSWINFKFYEADFGWGKPMWASTVNDSLMKMVRLIDTRESGGVEFWVTLSQQEMEIFECDPQLLQFADANPSVCV